MNERLVSYTPCSQPNSAVALIALNRPDALNALSKALTEQLIDCITQAEQDAAIGAIVLTGHGRAFCAGVDLKELSQGAQTLSDDAALIEVLHNRRKPMLGAINGFAVTGGLELALSCDFLYAVPTAVFADTHAKVGLLPTWGMSQKLSRLIGVARAKELSLSGNKIDAQTALDWGLVNKIVPAEQLLDVTIATAQQIAANNPSVVENIKHLIDHSADSLLGDGLDYEYQHSHAHNDNLDMSAMNERLNTVRKQ